MKIVNCSPIESQIDIRESTTYRQAEALFRGIRQPGSGKISDASEIHVSPDGQKIVFSGVLIESLEGGLTTRICQLCLKSGVNEVLTSGPNTDRLPKYSPDGRQIAFLSDRQQPGKFQLYLMDAISGVTHPAALVGGWIEYFHWSPDGRQMLLGVAGYGADISGGQGAVTTSRIEQCRPSWMPSVETGCEDYRWRRVWVYDVAADSVRPIEIDGANVWEAVWCGMGEIAAIVSSGPTEGHWYSARLIAFSLMSVVSRDLYVPGDQIGWAAASSRGDRLAFVEAICSDRGFVAGDLKLIDISSGEVKRADTGGVDVTCIEWRSERRILIAGLRGLETVVGIYDVMAGSFEQIWAAEETTAGGRYCTVAGLNNSGDCVLVGESFMRAPEIAVISAGSYFPLKSFNLSQDDQTASVGNPEPVRWKAPDGIEIEGWLLRPKGIGPYALVMEVHGGPVSHWRPRWLGRSGVHTLLLLQRGCAVFLPNPRGSDGRGQDFVRHVVGDMGGADTYDCLSGLDNLIRRGVADPSRLGVTGVSYGGFMSSWLITQDPRFAAAVAVAPINNFVTEHLLSNIPQWPALFLTDSYRNPNGQYFQRSPIMHAHKTKTPTLNICGALDRSAPAEEAAQFHSALLENAVKTMLVTYPEEGHGIRKWPAVIDYSARMVTWFDQHLPTMREARHEDYRREVAPH